MTNVVPFKPAKLCPVKALELVRNFAKEDKYFITAHAQQRQLERGFTDKDIKSCLLKGGIIEGPYIGKHGNWVVTLRRYLSGEEMKVAAAIDFQDGIIVITVMED